VPSALLDSNSSRATGLPSMIHAARIGLGTNLLGSLADLIEASIVIVRPQSCEAEIIVPRSYELSAAQ
jgi:two-component sensor histidine kinase